MLRRGQDLGRLIRQGFVVMMMMDQLENQLMMMMMMEGEVVVLAILQLVVRVAGEGEVRHIVCSYS